MTVDKVIAKISYWSSVFRYIDFGVTKTSFVDSLTKFTTELDLFSSWPGYNENPCLRRTVSMSMMRQLEIKIGQLTKSEFAFDNKRDKLSEIRRKKRIGIAEV